MKDHNKQYYHAYDNRYITAHAQGVSWSSDKPTPIVLDVIERYQIQSGHRLLEIGCGEGRDARLILEKGFSLLATDLSPEAISYCKKTSPQFQSHYSVLDCLANNLDATYDLIYAVAVLHMLVRDSDRDGFYKFIYHHLKPDGIALICTMGDGSFEMQSDIDKAFEIQQRNHESGKMMVAGTSCRMVSFETFREELQRNDLQILEEGFTSSMPDFDKLMYVVVKKLNI